MMSKGRLWISGKWPVEPQPFIFQDKPKLSALRVKTSALVITLPITLKHELDHRVSSQ
jgi:hypothetical protein